MLLLSSVVTTPARGELDSCSNNFAMDFKCNFESQIRAHYEIVLSEFFTPVLMVTATCFRTVSQGQFIYGTTQNGGANGTGTIFRFKLDGTEFTTEYNFAPPLNPGMTPLNNALLDVNGKLYGTTRDGGLFSAGVLFEFDPATGMYAVKKDFEYSAHGKTPSGDIVTFRTEKRKQEILVGCKMYSK